MNAVYVHTCDIQPQMGSQRPIQRKHEKPPFYNANNQRMNMYNISFYSELPKMIFKTILSSSGQQCRELRIPQPHSGRQA